MQDDLDPKSPDIHRSVADSLTHPSPRSAGPLRRVIEAARDINGYSLKDLTVLADQNDPYRLDTPAGHRAGAWAAEQFERTGREQIHIRGLHYSIVVRGDVRKPNGEVYVNDEADWNWLHSTAAKAARWLSYVPFTAIIDERNAAPVIYRRPHVEPETWLNVGLEVTIPDADDLQPTPDCSFSARQPYSLVIIGEKSSLGEVVLPIARQFEADLYLPTGEISDTLIYQVAADAAGDGRPLRVFYLADFDPTGYEMPANVGRKLQALRDLCFPDLEFECRSVALLYEQVRDLKLPSTPLKETERRSDRWRAAWGVEQTEIDALATLRPQVLRRIVTEALEPFHDATLAGRVAEAERAWVAEAEADLEGQIDQDKLDELKDAAETKLDELRDRIADLNRSLRLVAGDDIELPEVVVPEAEVDPETHGKPLVSSTWDWVDQTKALVARKQYEAGPA